MPVGMPGRCGDRPGLEPRRARVPAELQLDHPEMCYLEYLPAPQVSILSTAGPAVVGKGTCGWAVSFLKFFKKQQRARAGAPGLFLLLFAKLKGGTASFCPIFPQIS